jgi:hypothetical protein
MIEPVLSTLKLTMALVCVFFLRRAGIPTPLKAVIVWGVLAYLSINLIGSVVRGLVHQDLPREDEFESEVARDMVRGARHSDNVLTVFSVVLAVGYLYLLHHWWNAAVAVGALVIMLTRVPSLLFEIRMGLSCSAQARRLSYDMMPSGIVKGLCTAVWWLSLPLVWWGLRR